VELLIPDRARAGEPRDAAGPVPPVLYDHREDASGLPALLAAHGVPLQAAQLPVGDYVVSERICVERKARGDLPASIRDGRLFEQAERLLQAWPSPVLVIEDLHVEPMPESWRGAVSKLLEQGVTVLQTRNAEDTAAWIARLAKRARRDPSRVGLLPTGRRRSPPGADAQAELMLTSVHGISPATARRLLAHFGSVARVATAGARELQEVAGVGKGRARALRDVLGEP
jgi:DNA excision repair protein ERCC-4